MSQVISSQRLHVPPLTSAQRSVRSVLNCTLLPLSLFHLSLFFFPGLQNLVKCRSPIMFTGVVSLTADINFGMISSSGAGPCNV